ncbi:MAG: hypothetical protein KC613_15440 [Myxococcales bacterium]|nr:hypothetical protein [Myxococcales bacterium]MCB9522475.1 hypothetical protein [Myxococcales bacterium]
MSSNDHPKGREIHPDWGQNIAEFSLVSPAGDALASWYETGSEISTDKGWDPGYIYVSKAFPPVDDDGNPVDFAMPGSSVTVDPDSEPPPDSGSQYKMRDQWQAWNNQKGTGVLHKQPFNDNWDEVYEIYAAKPSGSGWAPSGAAYAALAVRKADQGLTWWVVADPAHGSSPSRSELTIAGTDGNLYFKACTSMLVLDQGDEQLYHSGDDPEQPGT